MEMGLHLTRNLIFIKKKGSEIDRSVIFYILKKCFVIIFVQAYLPEEKNVFLTY